MENQEPEVKKIEQKEEKILKKLNIINEEKPYKENKKTIMSEITKTNVNIKDIENVLSELQIGDEDDDEDYEEYIENEIDDEILDEDY